MGYEIVGRWVELGLGHKMSEINVEVRRGNKGKVNICNNGGNRMVPMVSTTCSKSKKSQTDSKEKLGTPMPHTKHMTLGRQRQWWTGIYQQHRS
jgi:hypothetical protein